MFARVTKRQAKAIADAIVKQGGQYYLNCKMSATSTRITSIFRSFNNSQNEGLIEVYSNYTRENVVYELPKKYQKLVFLNIHKNELDEYLYNN